MHRFRVLAVLAAPFLALALTPGATAQVNPPAEAARPSTAELVEDLRLLSIFNTLRVTPVQTSGLLTVAEEAAREIARVDSERKRKLDSLRDRLAAARHAALRGVSAEHNTAQQLESLGKAAAATRARELEQIVRVLSERVRKLLSAEQLAAVEEELAPSADQPWRRYAQVLGGPAPNAKSGNKLPADPGWWLKELRDLRIDSAEGNPAKEVEDFARKLTKGVSKDSPQFAETFNQGRAFAAQVLAMPDAAFDQRSWLLARSAAKQELAARNRQRVLDGKPLETFDAARWLVEEALVSPRATTVLGDRAAAH
jgi:hypothetical protein